MDRIEQLIEKRLASNKTASVNSKAEFEKFEAMTGFLPIDYLNGIIPITKEKENKDGIQS